MVSSVPSREAYMLMHDGARALAQVEAAGIRIDTAYLKATYDEVSTSIDSLREAIKTSECFASWSRRFGEKTNLGSRQQLAWLLFEELGFEPTQFTDKGTPSTDEAHLGLFKHEFITAYLDYAKQLKLRDTYLKNVMVEVCDGFLHPSFNLNLVDTYRSSSSNPNFQNIPVRNKAIAKLIRRAFIPRKNGVLLEIDYGQIEVRVSACYHKDPTMIDYIVNKGDMHLDMAAELFLVDKSEVTKPMRHVAKNSFVFAEFYGNYYPAVARDIWHAFDRDTLVFKGEPIRNHLRRKGITELGACNPKEKPREGTFEKHLKEVEERFWNVRFPVYRDWKETWYNSYLKRGWYKTKTGFVGRGVYRRNKVINAPIQGSAFHCLLWSIIRIVLVELKQRRLKAKVVGQIHDSLVMDVPKSELPVVLEMVKRVMTHDLRDAWRWLIVPLEIEAEMAETSWFEKKEIEI